jgi:hypothetical protein
MMKIKLVALLAAVLGPVLNSGREIANRAQCASNLRQIGVAAHLFAQENDKALPDKASVGGWPWDTRLLVLDQLLATGALTPEMLFCPSGNLDSDSIGWELPWEYYNLDTTFTLTTYVLLFDRPPGIPQRYWNSRLGDQAILAGRGIQIVPEGLRELAVDVVMSIGSSPDFEFMGIVGGAPEPHRTNHMNGDRPAGGNVLYLDGTVEWRHFADMRLRVTTGPCGGRLGRRAFGCRCFNHLH